jgi:hypothetical protein
MSQEFISYFHSLTEINQKEFVLAPHIIGVILGAEDGELDQVESKTLDTVYTTQIGMVDDSMPLIMKNLKAYELYDSINEEAAKLGAIGTPEFWKKKVEIFIQLLGRVNATIGGLPPESLKKYKQFTLEIMFKVASASGGGLLGNGQKINDFELNWMKIVCQNTSITVEDILVFLQRKNF